MEINHSQANYTQEDDTSVVDIFFHYLKYWKWFLLAGIIGMSLAFFYLRYATKLYKVNALVLIKDDQKGGRSMMDYNVFADLGIVAPSNSFDNELQLLQANTLMQQVIDSLKINVAYYKEGNVKIHEIYKQTPLFVSIIGRNDLSCSFILDKQNETTYSIHSDELNFSSTFKIGDEISTPCGILTFQTNPIGTETFPIIVRIENRSAPAITIAPVNKTSNVAEISLITPTPQKGIDVINTLIGIYNWRAINEKNYVAHHTINFIEERLSVISGELETAEKDVEGFKRSQGLTDVNAEAQLYLGASNDYDRKINDMEIQLSLLRYLKSYLVDHAGSAAPSNLGLNDQTILSMIQKYNEEIISKAKNSVGATASNPFLQEYDARIAALRDNLIKGISIADEGLQTTLKGMRKQENSYIAKTQGLSTQERKFRELYRQKEIKETLFVYLLQKREETGLSLALATPNALVVDPPTCDLVPVSPKNKIILLAALLVSLLIPVVVIYIMDLFDNKLRDKEQLLRVVKAPFLGDIPLTKETAAFPVLSFRSRIAEKFRIITSNLGFIVASGKGKVIMITSSQSGEGKSFFSRNLAMSLATLGKHTLLIDMDMRKSYMNKTLEMDPLKGVAIFLSDLSVNVPDIIDKKRFNKNLDIIPIKVFPPNPAELLASDRLDMLFDVVKKEYDYIIVDTAPIGLVADAYRINQFADATIITTRSNYSFKADLKEIEALRHNNKLCNLTIVINAVNESAHAYKYGYYGYGNKQSSYYSEEK